MSEVETPSLECILHLGEKINSEPVKKFSQELLDNCRQKAVAHKFRTTSCYHGINIPQIVTESPGCHSSCYNPGSTGYPTDNVSSQT